MIQLINGVWVGSVITGCVSDVENMVRSLPWIIDEFSSALICRLDSTDSVSSAMPSLGALRNQGIGILDVTGGVVVAAGELPELALERGLFNGFDQIWLIRKDATFGIPHPPKLNSRLGVLTPSDITPEHLRCVKTTRRWMESFDARIGISDGVTLEFVTLDEVYAHALDSLSCT